MSRQKKPEINTARFLLGALLGFLLSVVIFIALIAFLIEEGHYYYNDSLLKSPPTANNQ
jgi:hypothetical protein